MHDSLIGICNRVIVMREGHLAGEVGGGSGQAITEENIVALATGAVPTHTPTLH
ncbi:hypothetical protein QTH97_13685 [Variovorax sp. J22R24]|uniref:hypothetical protein n=1 Tax=Variovorax gracilis TaxID=3053502 RepID=UPI002577D2FE|nr:hypothetical protein [Variovorax sp. J22R24]MDM0105989.1 hypothetical protein [Variovorax sp. J22R24]